MSLSLSVVILVFSKAEVICVKKTVYLFSCCQMSVRQEYWDLTSLSAVKCLQTFVKDLLPPSSGPYPEDEAVDSEP